MTHPALELAAAPRQTLLPDPAERNIYAEFYEHYGPHNFQAGGRLAGFRPLVAGGFLHFDNFPDDHSLQIVVAEVDQERVGRHSRPLHPVTGAYDYFGHEPDEFVVATADGEAIHEWNIKRAGGVHHELINGVTIPYSFYRQTLHLDVSHPAMPSAHIEVNRYGSGGSMEFAHQAFAWILSGRVLSH